MGNFPEKVNSEIVSVQRVITDAGAAQLRSLIERHVARTGSPKGQRVLDNFDDYLPKFWQVVPPSEADCPEASDASPGCHRGEDRAPEGAVRKETAASPTWLPFFAPTSFFLATATRSATPETVRPPASPVPDGDGCEMPLLYLHFLGL